MSTIERVNGLPLLCLLPTTIKPSLSLSKLVLQTKHQGAKAYVPCRGAQGHCVLNLHYLVQVRDNKCSWAVYTVWPTWFKSQEPSPQAHQAPLAPQSLACSTSLEEDKEGFIVVGSKHRRGRLLTLSTADTLGMPNIASFLQVPSTQQSLLTQLTTPQSSGSLESS